MSWPNFSSDQENLALLCQDWPVDGGEYHAQNSLYGFNVLLKQYADLPMEEPLPWAMEHAISFGNPDPQFAEAESAMPILLAVTDLQAEILRDHHDGKIQVEPIGSAFFYMEKFFRERHPEKTAESERRGTLIFPLKSTQGLDRDYDRRKLIEKLKSLPEEFQPVAVSIFWRDFQRGTHQPFADAGLLTVTSGNPYDPEFLFRQIDLCRQFKYSCANNLSTSFCLSVLAGCHFFYLPTGPFEEVRSGVRKHHDEDSTAQLSGKRECIEASPFPPVDNRDDQLALAEKYAGKSSVREPEFFRELSEKGHHLVRDFRPLSLSLDMEESVDHLFQWEPRGIDNDGWGQNRSGFVIPGDADAVGVKVKFEIPPRPELDWRAAWSLTLDGNEVHHLVAAAGIVELEIPCRKDGERRTVLIEASDEIQLLNEGRRRCYRLTKIEWVDRLCEPEFGWEVKKESNGSLAATHLPDDIEFAETEVTYRDRSRWLLEQVNERGWVRNHCALSVPHRDGYAGVRVKLRLRERPEDKNWQGRFRVTVDGKQEEETEVGLGSWFLEIPSRRDRRSRRVEIALIESKPPGQTDDDLPDFRIKRIEWRQSMADSRSKRISPRLLRMEQLKEIAAQARSRRTPLWRRLVFRRHPLRE